MSFLANLALGFTQITEMNPTMTTEAFKSFAIIPETTDTHGNETSISHSGIWRQLEENP